MSFKKCPIEDTPDNQTLSNVLFIQGDWEGGLSNVAKDMMLNGTNVTKLVLEQTDLRYIKQGIAVTVYDRPVEEFKSWLEDYTATHSVDGYVIYNEYRPYNAIAYKLSEQLGIECIVLELGLLRPDNITIYSREFDLFDYLRKSWELAIQNPASIPVFQEPERLERLRSFSKIQQFSNAYLQSWFHSKILRRFTHFRDQRTMSLRYHFSAGLKAALRFQGRSKQSRYNGILNTKWSNKYYIVTLQVHSDSQIVERSDFSSVEEFIGVVVESFLKHAPEDKLLLFKPHPVDRGYKDYTSLINELNAKLPKPRFIYLDRISNPVALSNAIGAVMINSSMGISALIQGTPVIALGEAAFDLPGLTYQGNLDSFWRQAEPVHRGNVELFIRLLRHTSQGRGTFFSRMFAVKGHCKIKWPKQFAHLFPKQ